MHPEKFYLNIRSIHLAHEFILDQVRKCAYPQGRGSYGLVYVLQGTAEYRFRSGERISVVPGDFLFILPHCAYTIVTDSPFRHYTVNFSIYAENSSLGTLQQAYNLLQSKDVQAVERGFKKLILVWKAKKTGYEMQAMAALYELLSLFYSTHLQKHTSAEDRLLPAKEYIEQHFDQPMQLQELAVLAHMSVTNFRREWKKRYSKPPLQYRDEIRLVYAAEYLSSGYYTLTECAEKCGFSDVGYFIRFYKKHTGITPGKYRKEENGG